jgi:hypothetical protein
MALGLAEVAQNIAVLVQAECGNSLVQLESFLVENRCSRSAKYYRFGERYPEVTAQARP